MKKVLYILIFALAVVACKPQPMLKADRVSISVDAAGGTEVINITANYPWTASTSTSWIKLKYSEEDGTLTVTINRNNETDSRKGSITITSEDLSVPIEITQGQRDAIELDSAGRVTVDATAQTLDINLRSNVAIQAEVTEGKDWVSVVSTKAMEPHIVTLSVKANSGRSMRRALITISDASGNVSQQIMIDQEGKPQIVRVGFEGVRSFQVPIMTGLLGVAMTGMVFWDGESEGVAYNETLTRTYPTTSAGSLLIEAHNAETVSFSDVVGVTSLDLSDF